MMWMIGMWLACGSSRQEASEEEEHDEVVDVMDAHWADAERLRDLSVRGKRKELVAAAVALRDAPVKLPPELRAAHDALRDAANAVREAKNEAEGARAAAQVFAQCASCHAAAGVQFDLAPSLPEPKGDPGVDMLWHQVGHVQLWAGLVGRDTARWQRGAEALAKGVYAADDGTAKGSEGKALEQRLQAIAARADGAPEADRAAIYVQISELCAECHAR